MLEAVVVATQAVQVGGSRPSTGGEGNAVIEVGVFGGSVAAGELADLVAPADIPVRRS
jgi:hypothetical protein